LQKIFFCFLMIFIWLATPVKGSRPEIIIGTSYSPPLSTQEDDGYFDLLLDEAFSRLGMSAETVMLPAGRSLKDADNGHLDGDVGRVRGIERVHPNLVMVPEPVLSERRFTAFSVGMDPEIHSWDDLSPYNVGYVRGWKIFEDNSGAAKSVVPVDDTEMLFQSLKKGRIDIALSAELDGLAMAKKLGIEGIRVLDEPLAAKKMYLYLHESRKDLIEPLAGALRALKNEGAVKEIRRRVSRKYIVFRPGS
jgi:polar amino acid transport system substrate-binding protein